MRKCGFLIQIKPWLLAMPVGQASALWGTSSRPAHLLPLVGPPPAHQPAPQEVLHGEEVCAEGSTRGGGVRHVSLLSAWKPYACWPQTFLDACPGGWAYRALPETNPSNPTMPSHTFHTHTPATPCNILGTVGPSSTKLVQSTSTRKNACGISVPW